MNPKFYIACGAVALLPALFGAGFFFGKKSCEKQIETAVAAVEADYQLQIEKANSESQKVVIKTIKQNEIIKKAVSSYDVAERSRLLAKIQEFEARQQELLSNDA